MRDMKAEVHTTINRGGPGGVGSGLAPHAKFATKHATRYSVWSDMMPSGNRFRALVVCLAPLVCGALALGCDGGGHMPDAQTQPAAYSAELSVRFEASPDHP